MHESAVHTTTLETAYNGRLTTMGSSHPFLRANNLYTCMKIFLPDRKNYFDKQRQSSYLVIFRPEAIKKIYISLKKNCFCTKIRLKI